MINVVTSISKIYKGEDRFYVTSFELNAMGDIDITNSAVSYEYEQAVKRISTYLELAGEQPVDVKVNNDRQYEGHTVTPDGTHLIGIVVKYKSLM